ncbi:MAG: tetratricopeptide repeat protein, partial [bacterium]
AYYYMGVILAELGEFRNADAAFSLAVHLSPRNAAWWVQLGEVRENLTDFAAAEQAFDRALQLNPGAAAAEAGLERVRAAAP